MLLIRVGVPDLRDLVSLKVGWKCKKPVLNLFLHSENP